MTTHFMWAIIALYMASTVSAITYELDSYTECSSYSASNYEVEDWETVHVYAGRAYSFESRSSKDTCKISLHADDSYSYSSRILKVNVKKAVFDNYNIKMKVYDASSDYSWDLKYTLSKTNTYESSFETTQPHVYIVLDKTSCTTQTCRDGLDVDIKVTMESGITTGGIIGIVIGSLVGLALLIGVPICICVCCCAAASGGRRSGGNVTVTTTPGVANQAYPGTTAYPTQQYVVQGQNVTPYNQPQMQYDQTQYQSMAPPPYPGQPPTGGAPPYPPQQYPQQPNYPTSQGEPPKEGVPPYPPQ